MSGETPDLVGDSPDPAGEELVPVRDHPIGRVLSLGEFEALAERLLDRASFDYIAGGSGEEITLRDNVAAFRRRRLRPRVLVDVSEVNLSTRLLGQHVEVPFGIAPMAFQHMAHDEAEVAMARAARSAGAMFCLSTLSSIPLETVAHAAGQRWFQLYVHRDRAVSRDLVARAKAAGYTAIVLTVDLPVAGFRERDLRNDLQYPERFGNFVAEGTTGRPLLEVIGGFNERRLTWSDVAWLRGLTRLPVIIKGVMTGEDAALAVDNGAAAVWVSNHGGRQLDRAFATIDVLDEAVAAVDGKAEVYLDSGVRRGADVATALAMGAKAVFVGRPLGLALAVGGEAGVARAFELLTAELRITMALLGATSVGELNRRMVYP
ncbi:MAG: alpha-hydroxy-acid oxidizing protein [Chloroflexota bacterium]|nr:alpha-hydroxy-acid oxidizing protein [Chloroflexota bacterium]